MGRGQPTSRNGGATPASSQIIFLEQRIAQLEDQITEIPTLCRGYEAKLAELETESQRWQVSYRLQKKENYDLMTISIPELQLDLKDAQAKVAELRKENYDLMTKGDK